MKRSYKICLPCLVIVLITGCNVLSIMKKETKNPSLMHLFKIEDYATKVAEQTKGKIYILNYAVTDSVELTAKQYSLLQKALFSHDNYLIDDSKKCPFLPNYAIIFDDGHMAAISLQPCNKVLMNNAEGENITDLIAGNSVENILNEIVNSRH